MDSVTKEKQSIRTFKVLILSPRESADLDAFQRVAIACGESPRALTLKLQNEWAKKNKKKGRILAYESEVLEAAAKEGLKTNKATIIKYRTGGYLTRPNGNRLENLWWTNEDGRIVYDLRATLAFLRRRARSPKSRIAGSRMEKAL